MITVSSETIFDKLNTLRVHGSKPKYYHKLVGGNFRLDALQAGVLVAKIKYLPAWTALRRSHAKCYDELFTDHGLRDRVQLPQEIFQTHVYNQYVIRVGDQRDALRQFLAEKNIATEIYYPLSLHRQECFADLGHKQGDFPLSEKAAEETLALPISQEVTQAQQEYVVEMIGQFF
jgi:dTDP-4-amino-4,6-dideoxygalactose transaminase